MPNVHGLHLMLTIKMSSFIETIVAGLVLLLAIQWLDAAVLPPCSIIQGAARSKLFLPNCDRSVCSKEDVCSDCIDGGDSIGASCTDGCLYYHGDKIVRRRVSVADGISQTPYGDILHATYGYEWWFAQQGATAYLSITFGKQVS
jgi:hypothetical protein